MMTQVVKASTQITFVTEIQFDDDDDDDDIEVLYIILDRR